MARSIVRHSAVFLVSVLTILSAVTMWITVENVYADVQRPDMFFSEYVVNQTEEIYKSEYMVTEFSDDYAESIEHVCNIDDMSVKSQTPQKEGQDVISIREHDEYYFITALGVGSGEIEVTFVDKIDSSWKITTTYNIDVLSEKYNGGFSLNKTELLHGEETGITTNVYRWSYEDGELDPGEVEYEWTVETLDTFRLDASRCFEISDPGAKEPIIRAKTREQLLGVFPNLDPDEPLISYGMVILRVKSNGTEVAKWEQPISMVETYYEITPDSKQVIELDANNPHKEISLELVKASLDSNGEKRLEPVPAQFELENVGSDAAVELNGNKLSVKWNYDGDEGEESSEYFSSDFNIVAYERVGDDLNYASNSYYSVHYKTMRENPVELVLTDKNGNAIIDEDYTGYELFNDGKFYLKLTKSKKYKEIKDPSVRVYVGDKEIPLDEWAEVSEGYTYNKETGMVVLDGEELWKKVQRKEDAANAVCVTPIARVNDTEKHGYIRQISFRQASLDVPKLFNSDILFKGETKELNKEFNSEDYCFYDFNEVNEANPYGKTTDCNLVDIKIKEEMPQTSGEKVVSISNRNEYISLKARNYGEATIQATFQSKDDKNWVKECEYKIKVVDKKYSVSITTENGSEDFLPGESVKLNAEAVSETSSGKKEVEKDLTYEWRIRDGYGLSASKCFEIENPKDQNPTIKLKRIDELKEILEEEVFYPCESQGIFCLTVKKDGKEVASNEISLYMLDDFYELTPGSRDFRIMDPEKPIELEMQLAHMTLDGDGNRKTEIIDNAAFTVNGMEELKTTVQGNKVTVIPTEPITQAFSITAAVGSEEDGSYVEKTCYYEIQYMSNDLADYNVKTADAYPIESIEGKISTNDINVMVDYEGLDLALDKYEVKFVYFEGDEVDEENLEYEEDSQLEIKQKDRSSGASLYMAVIVPKEGSGLEGMAFSDPFAVYCKYSITQDTSDFTLDQNPLKMTDVDEDNTNVDYASIPDYGRYLIATTKNQFLLEMLDGEELEEGKDYRIEFYTRDPEELEFKENKTNKILSFPTTAGTYVAKAIGINSYVGETYFAFDLADPIGGAQVTGISSKTYTGKAQTQNPTVKLGGKTLKKGVDYELTYKNNVKPGKAVVTIVGKWKYAGNILKVFTINKAAGKVDKPRLLNVIATSSKKLYTAKWKKVPGATGYEASWRTRGAKKWSSIKVGASSATATAKNQKVGALYEYRVRATKKATATHTAATSSWSNVLYRYYYTVQKIRMKGVRGGINVSWAKDKNATGYQILYTTSTKYTDGTGAKIYNVSSKATTATVKGLQKGKTYQVQIRAIKKVGGIAYIGNLSNPIKVKVK